MRIFIFLWVFIAHSSADEYNIVDYNMEIENLTCSSNELNYEGYYLQTLLNSLFTNCTTINFLYLKENNISDIEDGAFRNLSNLTHIDLSDNNIGQLPTKIFSDTPNLQEANFSTNNITFLQTKLFHNLLYLTKVNFQYNDIHKIDENCFVNVPSLREINLGFNNLQSLHLNMMDNYGSIKDIILNDNPWNCDITKNLRFCDFMHMVVSDFWQHTIVPLCSSPNFANGLSWKKFLELNKPIFHSNFGDNPLANPIIVECAVCSKSSLSWQFKHHVILPEIIVKLKFKLYMPSSPDINLTTNAIRSYGEYYTHSKLIIRDPYFSDTGNYTCYTGTQPTLNNDTGYMFINRTEPLTFTIPPDVIKNYRPKLPENKYTSNSHVYYYTGGIGSFLLCVLSIVLKIFRCVEYCQECQDLQEENDRAEELREPRV